jgi:nucleoside phosphorylase
MESTAVLQTCETTECPCIIFRGISDKGSDKTFLANASAAAEAAADAAVSFAAFMAAQKT